MITRQNTDVEAGDKEANNLDAVLASKSFSVLAILRANYVETIGIHVVSHRCEVDRIDEVVRDRGA